MFFGNNNNSEFLILRFLMKNMAKYHNKVMLGFFKDKNIKYLAKTIFDEYEKSGSVLTKNVLKQIVTDPEYIQHINALFEITDADIAQNWVERLTKSWIIWSTFDTSMTEAVFILKEDVSLDTVEDTINKVVDKITKCREIQFDESNGLELMDTDSHFVVMNSYTPSPWKQLINTNVGGWEKGTLNIYAGESNIGKSIFLCQESVTSIKNGDNTLHVSLEMSESSVLRRISTNILDLTGEQYDNLVANDRNGLMKALQTLNALSPIPLGRLFIKQFPTGCTTVATIKNHIMELEKLHGLKINKLVVDYVNILSDGQKGTSDNLYLKVKNICEQLRGLGIELNIPVVTATQINRSGFGMSTISMDAISESAGLIHTADTLLSITQTPEMNTHNYYFLGCLKCRSGNAKNKQVTVTIDYNKMQLTEQDYSETLMNNTP